MLDGIYVLLLVACSSIMGLYGFFVGRCARKLPIIDNNLPWTMSRSQVPIVIEDVYYAPPYVGSSGNGNATYHRAQGQQNRR